METWSPREPPALAAAPQRAEPAVVLRPRRAARAHLPRLRLVELEDLPWVPAVLRDLATDYLALAERVGGLPRAVLPHLRRLLARTPEPKRIVDLCSGAGGPMAVLAPRLAAEGVEVVLTDLRPNLPALARVARSAPGIRALEQPVDARAVPPGLGRVRTVFMAFHHFAPDDARGVLASAARTGEPIGVFELAERRWPAVLMVAPIALAALLTAPFQRPWRWWRLALTYLVPLVPFVVLFDGVVSCLRAYSVDELERMVASIRVEGWTWEVGRERLPWTPGYLTYVLGYSTES